MTDRWFFPAQVLESGQHAYAQFIIILYFDETNFSRDLKIFGKRNTKYSISRKAAVPI